LLIEAERMRSAFLFSISNQQSKISNYSILFP